MSTNTIAKIEQIAVSDPGFSVVATIAAALGLPLDVLVERALDTLQPVGHGSRLEPTETPDSDV